MHLNKKKCSSLPSDIKYSSLRKFLLYVESEIRLIIMLEMFLGYSTHGALEVQVECTL